MFLRRGIVIGLLAGSVGVVAADAQERAVYGIGNNLCELFTSEIDEAANDPNENRRFQTYCVWAQGYMSALNGSDIFGDIPKDTMSLVEELSLLQSYCEVNPSHSFQDAVSYLISTKLRMLELGLKFDEY